MLNKNLLRFSRRNGLLHPAFVKTDDARLLDFAARLIGVYGDAANSGMTAAELAELTAMTTRETGDAKFGAGLDKLLLDRTEAAPDESTDYPGERRKLFTAGSDALKNCGGDLAAYRRKLETNPFAGGNIYGDLPDLEKISGFKPLAPRELLERYNVALAQGMLLYAAEMELEVSDPDPAEMRRMFKYLKFFRLLAETRIRGESGMTLKISGPFSLLGGTRRYGLQLANFFPAAVRLKNWRLEARIKFDGQIFKLELDEKSGLISHYRNFSSYVPEEIRMFHHLFAEKSQSWKIVGETPFIKGNGGEVIFPDFSFRRESDGRTIHFELFHRWHRGQLTGRLEWLAKHLETPMVLGIDRALADDGAFAALGEKYPKLRDRLLRFRDFPGVERTVSLLEKFSACQDDAVPGGKSRASR